MHNLSPPIVLLPSLWFRTSSHLIPRHIKRSDLTLWPHWIRRSLHRNHDRRAYIYSPLPVINYLLCKQGTDISTALEKTNSAAFLALSCLEKSAKMSSIATTSGNICRRRATNFFCLKFHLILAGLPQTLLLLLSFYIFRQSQNYRFSPVLKSSTEGFARFASTLCTTCSLPKCCLIHAISFLASFYFFDTQLPRIRVQLKWSHPQSGTFPLLHLLFLLIYFYWFCS